MTDSNDSRMVRLPVREMRDEPAPQRAAQEGDLPPLLTDERIERIAKTIPLEGCDRQTMGWGIGYSKESDFLEPNVPKAAFPFARAIEAEVRTAIAAAGGGVPQDFAERIAEAHDASLDDDHRGCRAILNECLRLLASSPQPEAAKTPIGKKLLELREQAIANGMQLLSIDEINALRAPQPEAAPAVAQGESLGAKALRLADAIDPFTRNAPPDHLTSTVTAQTLRALAAATEAPAQAAPSAGEVERAAHELLRTLDHGAYPREDIDLDLVRLVCDAALSHKEPKR